jgi:hypothetical protein
VTPANRDAKREQAFALSAQGIGVREIARRLGINKDTAMKYVRDERARRSHDRHAEDAIRDAIASLRHVLTDLRDRYDRIEGDGPHAAYARAKMAETIRRTWRDLIGLYGITLPETDPQRVEIKRMLDMTQSTFPANPSGHPAVGEQAIMDRIGEEAERKLVDLDVIAPKQATRNRTSDGSDVEDHGIRYFGGKGEPGDSYDLP